MLSLKTRTPKSRFKLKLISNQVSGFCFHFKYIFWLPVEIFEDGEKGIDFLGCEYNKDGDSYRSPWSNKYYPAIDDPSYTPFYPSGNLLEMEVAANDVFARYAKLYYDKDFITSVYFFESGEENGFGSCWLIKKSKLKPLTNFISFHYSRNRWRSRRWRRSRLNMGRYSRLQSHTQRRWVHSYHKYHSFLNDVDRKRRSR